MKRRLVQLLLISLAACGGMLHVSCKDDPPVKPPSAPGHTPIALQAVFVSTRWCRLQWNNDAGAASHRYVLIRDNRDTLYNDSILASVKNKILQDTVLKPGTNYMYWIYRLVNGQHWDSATVSVRTLDTTKDQYSWNIIRIGKPGSSFKGIWGTSSRSFWVCGFIDSGSTVTDIIHYENGNAQLYLAVGGSTEWQDCYGTSDSSVYFAGLGSIAHYDGHQFSVSTWVDSIRLPVPSGGVQLLAVWATPDDKELFAVGNGGLIIHRRVDRSWENLPSGTGQSLTNIFGFSNHDIYAVGTGISTGVLLHYDGTSWQTIARGDPNPPDSTYLLGAFTCVSGSNDDSLVLVGHQLYHRFGTSWQKRNPKTPWQLTYMEGVDAKQWNNLFVVGDFGEILKWDGEKWTMFTNYLDYSSDMILRRVVVLDGEVFIVGENGQNAVLIHGK